MDKHSERSTAETNGISPSRQFNGVVFSSIGKLALVSRVVYRTVNDRVDDQSVTGDLIVFVYI